MARSLPPLTWFRAFECAARHLNFTAAAEELGLTQSAVSQQVRSLELRFGVPLFQRKARGLALTDEGRRLLPDVSSALGALAATARAFDTGPAEGLLTVATSVSFAEWYIAPGLPRFLENNPGLRVRIVSTIWPDDFHASVSEVEVRFGSEALVGKGAARLLPDELIAVASPGRTADAENFGTQPLIEAVGTSHGWAAWAAQSGYPETLEPSLFVDSHGLAIDLARAGAGVALTSSLLAAPSLAEDALVRVHGHALPSEDGYFLATRARKDEAPQRFAAWLRDEIDAVLRRVGEAKSQTLRNKL